VKNKLPRVKNPRFSPILSFGSSSEIELPRKYVFPSLHPRPNIQFLARFSRSENKQAFTLIELLIVIAIMGILAAAIMIAINPGKRSAQARDAIRKQHINSIANALVSYYTLYGHYPNELRCDTSRGSSVGFYEVGTSGHDCSSMSGNDWQAYSQSILEQLVNEGFLKRLPVDPLNDSHFYYKYEPSAQDLNPISGRYCSLVPCDRYWIGARLESVDDPSKQYRIVFRCTDDSDWLLQGTGCKEVEFPEALWPQSLSFDTSLTKF